jgi:hypothetical protein
LPLPVFGCNSSMRFDAVTKADVSVEAVARELGKAAE